MSVPRRIRGFVWSLWFAGRPFDKLRVTCLRLASAVTAGQECGYCFGQVCALQKRSYNRRGLRSEYEAAYLSLRLETLLA